jgi:predicted GNAT superfamily acetyltransferase
MKGLEKIHEVMGKKFLFKVETSEDPKDYLKYEELRFEIWGDANDTLPGARNMRCENFIHEGSSLFIGVYAGDVEGRFEQGGKNLVGFSYGFVGVKDKETAFRETGNLQFYSQYTGVRQDFEHYGLGILIKEFQKEKLTGIFGVYTVTCTYDPLTGVNAYRNIHHFGMDVVEYREAHYGDFGGLLNRKDIPCDRLLVSWNLRKKIQRPGYDLASLVDSKNMAIETGAEKIRGRSGPISLEVIKKLNLDLDREFLLLEIPYDFYLMLRETDAPGRKVRHIPLDWRLKTRQAFRILFERNYRVIDFRLAEKEGRKRDFYILKK